MNRAIVVLGGNAFTSPGRPLTMRGQLDFAMKAVAHLEPLIESDIQMVISHGNGPQVGHILTRVEEALGKAYSIPLEVCVAESEGELGYVLELSLYNVLAGKGIERSIACLLTLVVVDERDPAFGEPTKPIGPFYTQAQAECLAAKGLAVAEDAGRGFRRVVPSPMPVEVVELSVLRNMLEKGTIVIAAGGGGIPVVRDGNHLRGVEAVVDKDHTAALLGREIEADLLVILTCVPCAYTDFGTARQEAIGCISSARAEELLRQGHFAPGSMKPKIEAAVAFARRPGARAVICDPASLRDALHAKAGTVIQMDVPG